MKTIFKHNKAVQKDFDFLNRRANQEKRKVKTLESEVAELKKKVKESE